MGSNQIDNHLEALAWVRNGPAPGEGGSATPIQYFRSCNGFEDRLGVVGSEGAAPGLLLYLDRQYTRDETAVFAFCPTTGDVLNPAVGAPSFAVYPIGALAQLIVQPLDRRVLDPGFVIPADPDEAVLLWERYDALLITPLDVAGDPLFADFCVAVARIPRKSGTTTYTILAAP